MMAADQFTQIANGLFRDTQLSFKAKGLFGLLSTHRDGWRMTVSDIVRRGRDGDSAVKSGLKELERHGSLIRERERAQTAPSARPRTSSPTCPLCKTPGHNQSRVFRQWIYQRWLIAPLILQQHFDVFPVQGRLG
ncbi:hypothetical protein ACSHXN_46900 (plasmid) [Streptomyces sp. HUAS TT11]|uniref:hypothetical protein n=1 Tax=Streptomyces sp. HUAS TT11 TaxID=3447508 RepID=UPI003F65896E